jgi:hypothetical protein
MLEHLKANDTLISIRNTQNVIPLQFSNTWYNIKESGTLFYLLLRQQTTEENK